MDAGYLLLIGWAGVALAMALAWLRQRRTGNAGVVDLVWTAALGALALLYAAAGDGWGPRRVLAAGLVGLWSLRLSLHIARRLSGEAEDGRYAELRRELGARFQPWLFWFYQAQGVLDVLLSLVFLRLATAQEVGWSALDALAVLVWVVALAGESLADRQLARFRADPANRGRTCREGLWRWSRHPNYFFEWLNWCAYALLATSLELGWLAWLAPAAMLFLVLKVTGIPPTERQALRSRGADYEDYQRTTNAFFPGPRRLASDRITT